MQKEEDLLCLVLSAKEVSTTALIHQCIQNSGDLVPSQALQTNLVKVPYQNTLYKVSVEQRIIEQINKEILSNELDKIDFCAYVYETSSRQSFDKMKECLGNVMRTKFKKGWIRNLIIGIDSKKGEREVAFTEGEQVSKEVGLFIQMNNSKPFDFQYIFSHIQAVYPKISPTESQYSTVSTCPSMPRKVKWLSDHYGKIINGIILGCQQVGKSAFALSLAGQSIGESYIPTIGVDFRFHNVEWQQKAYRIHLWQTSGAPRFEIITYSYLRSTQVIFILYDSKNRQSFQKIHYYFKMCQEQCYRKQTFKIIIVSNKYEGKAEPSISFQEGQQLAEKLGALFFQINCKQTAQVENCFLKGVESHLLSSPS